MGRLTPTSRSILCSLSLHSGCIFNFVVGVGRAEAKDEKPFLNGKQEQPNAEAFSRLALRKPHSDFHVRPKSSPKGYIVAREAGAESDDEAGRTQTQVRPNTPRAPQTATAGCAGEASEIGCG